MKQEPMASLSTTLKPVLKILLAKTVPMPRGVSRENALGLLRGEAKRI
jgi:hypothetical protein